MTDLDYIHKAIIDSKGCDEPTDTIDITENGEVDVTNYATANVNVAGGDSFPYEYYCPDDFSVVINPEDWNIDDYESYAEALIPAQIQVPEGCLLKLGSCNNKNYNINDDFFLIKLGTGKYIEDGYVKINLEENKISVTAYSKVDLSIIGSVSLNFKDLIFLGNKKEQ